MAKTEHRIVEFYELLELKLKQALDFEPDARNVKYGIYQKTFPSLDKVEGHNRILKKDLTVKMGTVKSHSSTKEPLFFDNGVTGYITQEYSDYLNEKYPTEKLNDLVTHAQANIISPFVLRLIDDLWDLYTNKELREMFDV